MRNVYPDYYPRFHCLAGRCRHTCCAGWEIDIDGDTLAVYDAIPGGMGARLRAVIAREPAPHFVLAEGERCPLLNEENLCELILYGGEELLCQICRDHPRWRSFLPGRTETGVGLCCEAAAKLILTQTEPVRLCAEGDTEEEPEEVWALLRLREAVLSAAQDRSLPLEARMENVLALCGAALPHAALRRWAEFYLALERLDERWTGILTDLRENVELVDITELQNYMTGREHEVEQLLVYFLHRHFLTAYDDGDAAGKAAFAVLSTRLLTALGALFYARHGHFTTDELAEYARLYSAEVEYSQENLDALFDALCPRETV